MLKEKLIKRGVPVATPEQMQRAALTIAKIEAGSVGTLEPEFLTIPASCRFSSLGRTEIYLAIRDGRIKSISLRKPGTARGRRLVSVASLREYLLSFQEGARA
jgi:hypothetical protein